MCRRTCASSGGRCCSERDGRDRLCPRELPMQFSLPICLPIFQSSQSSFLNHRSRLCGEPIFFHYGSAHGVTVHSFPDHRVKAYRASIEPRSPEAGEQTIVVDQLLGLAIVHKTGPNFYYLACENPRAGSEQTLLPRRSSTLKTSDLCLLLPSIPIRHAE